MVTSLAKPANATISVAVWSASLLIAYTIVVLEVTTMAHVVFAQAKSQSVGTDSHTSKKRAAARSAQATHYTRQVTGLLQNEKLLSPLSMMLLALLTATYLHSKLRISSGDRNRLAKLHVKRPNSEPTFFDEQREHAAIGQLFLCAGMVSEEQLQAAKRLSKSTHQLLGDSLRIVSQGDIDGDMAARTLQLQRLVTEKSITFEKAVSKMRTEFVDKNSNSILKRTAPTAIDLHRDNHDNTDESKSSKKKNREYEWTEKGASRRSHGSASLKETAEFHKHNNQCSAKTQLKSESDLQVRANGCDWAERSHSSNNQLHEPVADPTLDEPTLDESTLDESTLDESTLDESTLDESTLDESTLDESTLDEPTLDEPIMNPSLNDFSQSWNSKSAMSAYTQRSRKRSKRRIETQQRRVASYRRIATF